MLRRCPHPTMLIFSGVLQFLDLKQLVASMMLLPSSTPEPTQPTIQSLTTGEKLRTNTLGPMFAMSNIQKDYMRQGEKLSFLPIYGLGTIAVMTGDVTTLAHETWNKSIKEETIITKPFLCSARNIEALSGLWNVSTNSWKEAVLWRCQSTHGG